MTGQREVGRMKQSCGRCRPGSRRWSGVGVVAGAVLVAVCVLGGLSGCTSGLPAGVPSGQFVVISVEDIGVDPPWNAHGVLADRVWFGVPADGARGVMVGIVPACGGGGSGRFMYRDHVFSPVEGTGLIELIGCIGPGSENVPLLHNMLTAPLRLERVSATEMTLTGSGLVLHFRVPAS